MSEAEPNMPARERHRVKLAKTAAARTTSADLLRAIIANSERLGQGSVNSTIRKHDLVFEVSRPDDPAGRREFVFRRFQRAVGGKVSGGRSPLFDQVTVSLAKPVAKGNWLAEVTGMTTGRDKALADLARLPRARAGQGGVAERLRAVVRATEPMPGVTSFDVEPPRDGQRSPDAPVTIVVTLKSGTVFKLRARVSPRTGQLEVSTTDGRVTFPPMPIHVGAGAPRWAIDRGLGTALIPALGYFVGRRLGHRVVPPDGPGYVQGQDGARVGTATAYMKLAMLHHANRLLELATLPKPARRHVHRLRHQLIDELGTRAGSPGSAEHRDVVCAMFPRIRPIIQRYGTKRRKPVAFDVPEGALGLPAQLALGSIPGWSNLLAAVFSPDPAQQLRYTFGLVGTAPSRALRRWLLDRDIIRQDNDTAPADQVYRDAVGHHLGIGGGTGGIDAGGRVAISLWLGGAVDPTLLSEIAGRRMAASFATGLGDYATQTRFGKANLLADQAKRVAGRGEAVNEFLAAQGELELLFAAVPELLAEHRPAEAEVAELAGLLDQLHGVSRETWDVLETNGLSPGALRTKAAPLRTPGTKTLLTTRAGPSLVGTVAGVAMAATHPALGLLGLRSLADTITGTLKTNSYERDKAKHRDRRAKANQAYRYKVVDDEMLAARGAAAEHLGVEAELPEPLPAVKRRKPSFKAHAKSAAITSTVSLPLSAIGFVVPDLYYLAVGLLLSGPPSQWANEAYIHARAVVEHFQDIKAEAVAKGIAYAEGAPQDFTELRDRLKRQLDALTRIRDRTRSAVSIDGMPHFAREIQVADVFEELRRRGSVHLLERFKSLVAGCGGNERRLYRRLRLMTPDYGKTKPKHRAARIAEALDAVHEAEITDIAKLELMGRFLAEYVPEEFQLASVWPAEKKPGIGDEDYVAFAHVMQELWFVTDPSGGREMGDLTGRFAAVAWLAAAANGAIHREAADPEKRVLDVAAATRLVPASAALIALDIKRLAAGWDIENLMTDTPPRPGTERTRREADAAKDLRALLGHDEFRERYIARVAESLTELRGSAPVEVKTRSRSGWDEITRVPTIVTSSVGLPLSLTVPSHLWSDPELVPSPPSGGLAETVPEIAVGAHAKTVDSEIFAELLSYSFPLDPVDSLAGNYLSHPRTRTGARPDRDSHLLFAHRSGAYIREWPVEQPSQPLVLVVRRCGSGAGVGRLTEHERKFLAETDGVVVECGLPNDSDLTASSHNQSFETEQLLVAMRYVRVAYRNPHMVVVGDDDCHHVVGMARRELMTRYARHPLEPLPGRLEDPETNQAQPGDSLAKAMFPDRARRLDNWNTVPQTAVDVGRKNGWESFATWPERARLTFTDLEFSGGADRFRMGSGLPSFEPSSICDEGAEIKRELAKLSDREVWARPVDSNRESHLTRPRTSWGEEPDTANRLLLSRPEGCYVREWSGRRKGYPVIVAVRRCGSEAGSGGLSFGELNFLSEPLGTVIECGIPDFSDSAAGRERDAGYAVEQVARAVKYAQVTHPDSEIVLVCDQDCNSVLHRVVSATKFDASRVVHQRPSVRDAWRWAAGWPHRASLLLTEVGLRRDVDRLRSLSARTIPAVAGADRAAAPSPASAGPRRVSR